MKRGIKPKWKPDGHGGWALDAPDELHMEIGRDGDGEIQLFIALRKDGTTRYESAEAAKRSSLAEAIELAEQLVAELKELWAP